MLRGECINARWSKEIMEALPDGEVVMSRGTVDYQGCCDFVARLDDGRWLHVHWAYGSCAVCDGYEDMEDDARDTAFRALGDAMSAEVFADYIIGCVGTKADWLTWEHQDATGFATAEELLARVLGGGQ